MKKLLSLFATINIAASSSSLVISCNSKKSADTEDNKIDLKSQEIINKVLAENVQNLNSLDEVNTKLSQFVDSKKIAGLTRLTANLKTDSQTDVVVEITIDTTNYNLLGKSTFEIIRAINNKIKKDINSVDVINFILAKNIKNLSNLNEVKLKLIEVVNSKKIAGLTGLTASLKAGSQTDVFVTIVIDSTNYNLIGQPSFEITEAIKKVFQTTIYIDENGKQISTNKTDLYNIKTKEIKQIGFYKNKNNKIQVIQMPKTVEIVPNYLPKEITSLDYMFYGTSVFNQDISSWDTSNVTSMKGLFQQAQNFNQDISSWNLSNVTNIASMFYISPLFNQDISSWDTSKITNMEDIFHSAQNFNQDISSWDTSNVTNMSHMFENDKSFNCNIGNWNTSNVINMESMFDGAQNFNGNISSWDTSNVNDMGFMFANTIKFNQDISSWDTSNVTNMNRMFYNTNSFNQDISNWKVSNVKTFFNFDSYSNVDWGKNKKPIFK